MAAPPTTPALFDVVDAGALVITRPATAPQDAAPFDETVARQVPRYGTKGTKTTGVLALSDGHILPEQDSGINGPALRMPKPRTGMNGNLVTHVEAHAVASMRENDTTDATLYVNQPPCQYPGPREGEQWGCESALPYMLRPDEKLTIYAPNGYAAVFRGLPR